MPVEFTCDVCGGRPIVDPGMGYDYLCKKCWSERAKPSPEYEKVLQDREAEGEKVFDANGRLAGWRLRTRESRG